MKEHSYEDKIKKSSDTPWTNLKVFYLEGFCWQSIHFQLFLLWLLQAAISELCFNRCRMMLQPRRVSSGLWCVCLRNQCPVLSTSPRSWWSAWGITTDYLAHSCDVRNRASVWKREVKSFMMNQIASPIPQYSSVFTLSVYFQRILGHIVWEFA